MEIMRLGKLKTVQKNMGFQILALLQFTSNGEIGGKQNKLVNYIVY